MGNAGGRPSCLGEKSQKPDDFLKDSYLKDLGLASGRPSRRNNAGGQGAAPEKPPLSPRVIENGWSVVTLGGPSKSQQGSPLPKQNNMDVKVQNGGALSCSNPLKAQLEAVVGAAWSPPMGLAHGSGWVWKPLTTTEVTEVTEVTETVVTEIVEVTEYPGGDRSKEPTVTRRVKVLTECAGGALSELQNSQGDPLEPWSSHSSKATAAFLGEVWGAEQAQVTLRKLLTWVSDMEELMANQKPPSSEAKVVKAQLQEQKLLRRLLDERRSHVEGLLQERWAPSEPPGTTDGHGRDGGLANLQEKWRTLIQGAEARHSSLEQILPAAHTFQESADVFQDWLASTERKLAELWRANGSLSQAQGALQQVQDLCEEIRSKTADLERALEHGQRLLEMVAGEEAHLAQEKMDSLRMRFLLVGQSSAAILHRLEQTLEASCWLGSTEEDLALWLQRLEKELVPQGGQPVGDDDGTRQLSATDREKFEQVLVSEMDKVSHLSTHLEELGQVHLEAEAIQRQLADLKLSIESEVGRGLTAKPSAPMQQPLRAWCLTSPGQAGHLTGMVCRGRERPALHTGATPGAKDPLLSPGPL
ncbi:microtubule-actin cross-linking factor 1-like [Zootoca vivipara]|uniref:microtubule-actin cross-linking factor 1-like n=1 Tax=Zootoca vivipara TaxID=8524 RepID=UPI00293BA90C|nr:microtubule-actin cross-linking factor 1-like [Zootoca vivipara]